MSWKTHKLGDILNRKRLKVNLQFDVEYKLVTIKLWHKGVVLREFKLGREIKSKMFQINEGDFILSGIDARNGAFGIVPNELNGAIVTNDFWCLEPKKEILRKDFFLFLPLRNSLIIYAINVVMALHKEFVYKKKNSSILK